ncbi:DUF2218 domain-containing protein [Pseudogemmobacter sonorensis]|uniref:DUF2218 domain-containing protein n=1 Tax=Pseudogemmobacter sonorensis TaxID=2989681 RepID=UPI003687C76E
MTETAAEAAAEATAETIGEGAAMPARSRAVITLTGDAVAVLEALLNHMTEHATVTRRQDGARLENPFCQVEIELLAETIHVDVAAPTPEILALVREFIAGHVFEFAGEDTTITWTGQDVWAGLPPQFRQARVLRAFDLTPHMRRVVFACDRPEDFTRDAGYHFRLLLPPAGRAPQWPVQRPDGRLDWPQGEDALVSRVYTIRAVDPAAGTVAVDFVLHGGGPSPAADFARHARPGDLVGLMGPGGDGRPAARRALFLGDEAALPAILRMVEETGPEMAVEAIVELEDRADIQPFARAADVTWLPRDERAPGDADLLERALAQRLDNGAPMPDLIWAGCEKAVAGRIRTMLHTRFPEHKKQFRIYAWWRRF